MAVVHDILFSTYTCRDLALKKLTGYGSRQSNKLAKCSNRHSQPPGDQSLLRYTLILVTSSTNLVTLSFFEVVEEAQ